MTWFCSNSWLTGSLPSEWRHVMPPPFFWVLTAFTCALLPLQPIVGSQSDERSTRRGCFLDGAKMSCKTTNCVWGMTPISLRVNRYKTKWRDLFQNGKVATSFKLGQLKRERTVIRCDEELLEEGVEGAHIMPHACAASSNCGICLCKSKLPCFQWE